MYRKQLDKVYLAVGKISSDLYLGGIKIYVQLKRHEFGLRCTRFERFEIVIVG